jgi:excisionase family DNA binding protein
MTGPAVMPFGYEQLLTPEEAARRLKCGRSFVYSEAKAGRLRVMHLGKRLIRITETAFSAYLAAAGRPVTPETSVR